MSVKSKVKRHVVRVLRWFPWSGMLLQRVMHFIQPRVSVGVVGVLLDASQTRVLLVEHLFHTDIPWGLPGGWMDRGEHPEWTVEREFLEETGLKVRAAQPLVVHRNRKFRGHMDVVYLCVLAEGDADDIRLSGELLNWKWTPLDDLPYLSYYSQRGIKAAAALVARGAVPGLADVVGPEIDES